MVESTRSKSHMDQIKDPIAKLPANQLALAATQNNMSTKFDELLQKMTHC